MDLDLTQLLQLFPLGVAILEQALALVTMIPWGPRIALLLFMLWVFYLAAMNLLRVHRAGKLGRMALALGLVVMVIGYALDVLANLVVFTVLLLEPPRWGEWTVTDRLQRHHGGTTWRSRVAQWFETELLGQFDPDGSHVAPRKVDIDA
jgi:hypothetical protein